MGLTAVESWLNSRRGQDVFLNFKASKSAFASHNLSFSVGSEGPFHGGNLAWTWSWQLTFLKCRCYEWV